MNVKETTDQPSIFTRHAAYNERNIPSFPSSLSPSACFEESYLTYLRQNRVIASFFFCVRAVASFYCGVTRISFERFARRMRVTSSSRKEERSAIVSPFLRVFVWIL